MESVPFGRLEPKWAQSMGKAYFFEHERVFNLTKNKCTRCCGVLDSSLPVPGWYGLLTGIMTLSPRSFLYFFSFSFLVLQCEGVTSFHLKVG